MKLLVRRKHSLQSPAGCAGIRRPLSGECLSFATYSALRTGTVSGGDFGQRKVVAPVREAGRRQRFNVNDLNVGILQTLETVTKRGGF